MPNSPLPAVAMPQGLAIINRCRLLALSLAAAVGLAAGLAGAPATRS